MDRTSTEYQNYLAILREELIMALGCTEPIAVSLAAAEARKTLGRMPERLEVAASGNIIKNVKGVVVPATDGLRGIEAAAVIGALAGDPALGLQVLSTVTPKDIKTLHSLDLKSICSVSVLDTKAKLHIIVRAFSREDVATVEIVHTHNGIVRIEKNGELLLSKPYDQNAVEATGTDRESLSIEGILDFAKTVRLDDVRDLMEQQIDCNKRISDEGLKNHYGMSVGTSLLSLYGSDRTEIRAIAAAAAGSDARMSGCELPVVINSGSGNQGMTTSLPVIVYAQALKADDETLIRALVVSNLIAIHQKSKIGRLSAYCGAVSAAAGAGAGITFLYGGTVQQISDTVTNTLANVAGVICDGAKPSCAAKISSSLYAALLGHKMAMNHAAFGEGEGIVQENAEQTIDAVAEVAREGMQETDNVILKIMTA